MKLLEITIDDKFTFDKQVDIVCTNAAIQLNVLYRVKGILDLKNSLNYIILLSYTIVTIAL